MRKIDNKFSLRLILGGSIILITAIALVVSTRSYESAPDFSAITEVNERKEAFFGYLRPAIEQVNHERAEERAELVAIKEKLAEGSNLNFLDRRHLRIWTERYGIDYEFRDTAELVDILLLHIDQIPESMVLAQAAMESGWGTSRFAVNANNYFGQWCYSEGCGLVPDQRASGANHEVRAFDSAEASVQSYFRNINGHAAYAGLRELRADIRNAGEPLSGFDLVEGLQSYSQRGQAYIDELQSVIRFNDLE